MTVPNPTGAPPEIAAFDRVLIELRTIRELIEQTRKPILTVAEVARLVGRSEYTVRRWVGAGRLPATRVAGTGPAGRLLVRRDDLDRLLASGVADPAPAGAATTERRP